MTAEILNLVTLFILGIAYLVLMSKFNITLTGRFIKEKNTAGYILYASVLIASAIYLVQTADIASSANRYFMPRAADSRKTKVPFCPDAYSLCLGLPPGRNTPDRPLPIQ